MIFAGLSSPATAEPSTFGGYSLERYDSRAPKLSRRGRQARLGFEPAAGQLLSVLTDDGRYGLMKLLAVDRGGVHARLYVQRFGTRPSVADVGELALAAFGPGHDNPFSIGHMPISYRSFAGWEPLPVGEQPVTEAELDGYRTWQEASGGYF